MVLDLFRRGRRLSRGAERRLLIALARAEKEVVRTHVQNALDVLDAVAGEMPKKRAIKLYLDELEVDEPIATMVAQRVLSQIERDDGAADSA